MAFIDANEVKLQTLLSNAQEAYEVPLYQRPYAWVKDNWDDIFDDIISLNDDDIHFLGSIVVVPEGEHKLGINYYQVVDGQQRLATVLIWLCALRDIAKEKGNNDLSNYITETFLFAKQWKGGKQDKIPKLKLGELDNDAFQIVLEGKKQKCEHLIFTCHEFFKSKSLSEDLWQNLINKVSIVHMNAFNHFNAFRLFETLNDRGLELSGADLIKNLLLMKVASNETLFQDTINEWNEMYQKVRDKEPVKFIRRYMLSNYKGRISDKKLYEGVRKKLEDATPPEILEFIKDLNKSATIYKKIFETTFISKKVNKALKELHLVEVAPSYTLLLKIMPYLERQELNEIDMVTIMKMVEIFHIRWGVCSQSTSRLDQIYNGICMGLPSANPNEFVSFIKSKFDSEIKSNVDDEVFKRNFINRSFNPSDSRTKFILWKLSEPTGETFINITEVETEHILPQTLSDDWVDYLKTNLNNLNKHQIIALYEENKGRIGNLAIIKGEWNRIMSNRLFKDKSIDYEKSEFARTKELINYKRWTFNEINERCKLFSKMALDIWNWS